MKYVTETLAGLGHQLDQSARQARSVESDLNAYVLSKTMDGTIKIGSPLWKILDDTLTNLNSLAAAEKDEVERKND